MNHLTPIIARVRSTLACARLDRARVGNLGLLIALIALTLVVTTALAIAQGPTGTQPRAPRAALGTGFTYQGQLKQSGSPVNGVTCDFQFGLYDALTGPTQIGTTQPASALVTNGYFTISNLDFGGGAFNGDARWLDIQVRCPTGSGSYTPLTPRQPLTPAPMALALPGLYTQQNATSPNLIGGYSGNTVTSGMHGATIGGGGSSSYPNSVTGSYGTVGGGLGNTSNIEATVGGGGHNTASGTGAATVGGGEWNIANGHHATLGGGRMNTASGFWSVVGGGITNTITSAGQYATIGGGIQNTASDQYATVGGGTGNSASSASTTVGGGWANIASNVAATVPGGANNEASGAYSFAAGADGHATHTGSFVWSSAERTDSWGVQTFTARAHGGVRFYTASGTGTGVQLSSGGGSWGSLSDRNAKANFASANGRDILALVASMPIETWNYKSQDTFIRHIGPMAQDFYAAFKVGEDDTHITTVDADGVALAAIQGLNQLVEEKDARITKLESHVSELQKQNASLEARLTALEQSAGVARSPVAGVMNNGWIIGVVLIAIVVVGTRRWGVIR